MLRVFQAADVVLREARPFGRLGLVQPAPLPHLLDRPADVLRARHRPAGEGRWLVQRHRSHADRCLRQDLSPRLWTPCRSSPSSVFLLRRAVQTSRPGWPSGGRRSSGLGPTERGSPVSRIRGTARPPLGPVVDSSEPVNQERIAPPEPADRQMDHGDLDGALAAIEILLVYPGQPPLVAQPAEGLFLDPLFRLDHHADPCPHDPAERQRGVEVRVAPD